MHPIQRLRLSKIDPHAIIALMTHPSVRQHLPLSTETFGLQECTQFVQKKEAIWEERGYGPWAFLLEDEFVGWGGLQPFEEDVEIALVLHPNHWGLGKRLYEIIIEHAFQTLDLASVIVLFPLSRKNVRGILKLGFFPERDLEIEGEPYRCYRLKSC